MIHGGPVVEGTPFSKKNWLEKERVKE